MAATPGRAWWENGIPAAVQRSVMFVAGLTLLVFEAVRSAPVRWELLPVYMGMMGMPFALRADDARRAPTGEEQP